MDYCIVYNAARPALVTLESCFRAIEHSCTLGYTLFTITLPGTEVHDYNGNDMSLGHDERLLTIQEIGRAVASNLDLGTLYDTIYEQVGRLMDTRTFFVGLHRPVPAAESGGGLMSDEGRIDLAYMREESTLLPRQDMPFGGSVTSLVIERGTPLLFNTLAEYRHFARANGLHEVTIGDSNPESMIFVPLHTGNETIGALSVQCRRPFAYEHDDLQTLSVIAAQAAVAIENANLFLESQNNVRRTQALLAVARVINSSLDLHTVLDSILEGMLEVMPYYLAAVLMPNQEQGVLEIAGVTGPLADERRRQIKIPFGSGVTGHVFTTGEPLNVPDVAKFADYYPHGIEEVRSEMAVPLKRGDTVIGVLDVERDVVNGFPPEELDLLMLFASQAAIAIENARLFSEQQDRVFELQTIQSIVQKTAPLLDIPAVAAVIDTELRRLIDYQACGVFLLDDQGMIVPVQFPGSRTRDIRLAPGEGISGWIVERGKSVLVPNTLEDPRVLRIEGTPVEATSFIGAPLVYQGSVRGAITLTRLGPNQFDENALRLLEIISAQAAIAFDRARLYEQLRLEAITDPLTKLYNRRHLIERFREERSRAVRNRHELTAIMLDIDGFKQVNDTHGHDAGDVVLEELARVVRGAVRLEDLAARYGGEEFCVLLPEVPVQEAETVGERLRGTVEKHRLPPECGVASVTVSVGMALLSRLDEGSELFTRADRAMYEVKRLGGNRVCVDRGTGSGYHCLEHPTGEFGQPV
jgi:diguanylate cyclase (GGDEF)-like protein